LTGGEKIPEIGDVVTYIDSKRVNHNALVTAVWGEETYGELAKVYPSLNLVYVSKDKAKTDPFGRQIDRATSIVHRSVQPAGANCWE
jgi:hypothetical protein